MIGADEFSELAAKMEKAADNELWDEMKKGHSALIETYDALARTVAETAGSEIENVTVDVSSSGDDEIMGFFPD